jgi:hypothetical protein
MSQAKESLNFEITLGSTFHDKVPAYAVYLNGRKYASGTVSKKTVIKFAAEVYEGCESLLSVRLENKTDSDTIQNEDKTEIVKDMTLDILSIIVNDVDWGQMLWSHSEFVADNFSRETIPGCVNLGWNGSFNIKFTSPYYEWLLANI